MAINFRRKAKAEFARLLEHWREIEAGIKRAEQVNGKALIPAINELRYASRQLYFGILTYSKGSLRPCDASIIKKRLIIAEQYLLNADHDVVDSIVSFYRKVIERIQKTHSATEITVHYAEYPLLCERIYECEELIRETRRDYGVRRDHYERIRSQYFDFLVKAFDKLQNAEINAEYDKEKLKRELLLAQRSITRWKVVSALSLLFGFLGLLGLLF